MSTQSKTHPSVLFRKSSVLLAGLVVTVSIVKLAGWILNRPLLLDPLGEHSPVNSLAVFCFLLVGASSLSLFHYSPRHLTRLAMLGTLGLGLLACAAEFSEIFFSFNFPFDTFLYKHNQSFAAVPAFYHVQMAASTAFSFILLFLAIIFGSTSSRALKIASNFAALFALTIALLALLGHLYGLEPLINYGVFTNMSIYSALLFLSASLAIMGAQPKVGFMSTFASHRPGGLLARILIPVAILFLLSLGFISHQLTSSGLIEEKDLTMIMMVSSFLFLTIVVYQLSKKINFKDSLKEKAEETLFRNNELYAAVLEHSMAGYWDWDLVKDELHVSKTFIGILGYEGITIADKELREKFVHPEDRERIGERVKQHIASKGVIPFQTELRGIHKNGSIVWIMSKGQVIRWDDNGRPLQMIGSHIDITPLKEANERLKESEMMFANLFGNAPVSLAIVKIDTGVLLDFNDSFTELFGYNKDEAIGKTTIELGVYVDPNERAEMLVEARLAGRVSNREITFQTKARELRHTSFNIFLFNLFGEECGLVAIADITDLKKQEQKLRESQQLFSTLFYKSPLFLAIFDGTNGNIVDANDKTLDFLGIRRETYHRTSKDFNSFLTNPADQSKIAEMLATNGALSDFEMEARDHTGKKHIISLDISLITVDGAKSWLVTGIDITIRREAEQKIVNLLAKKVHDRTREVADYKLALDESAVIAITDHKGVITYVNDNFCQQSKYTKAELIGQTHRIVNSGYHPKEFFSSLWRTISKGETWQGEIKNKAKDGTFYWVHTTIVPFLSESEQPGQYLAIRFDITARKEAEEGLLRSKSDLRSILENSDTGYVLLDASLRIKSFNKLASRFAKKHLGREIDVNTDASEYISGKKREVMAGIMSEAMSGGYPSYEIHYPAQDGEGTWYHSRFAGVFSPAGVSQGVIMQISDITERKKQESLHEDLTLDLVRQNQDLERFAHIVSHNLRSPVSTILGLCAIIKATALEGKDFELTLDGLEKTAAKLDNVIRDLNSILQIKREVSYERKDWVDLKSLTEEVLADLQLLIEKNHGKIVSDFRVSHIYSNSEYLHSIFHNLISNSLRYHQLNTHPIIKISGRASSGKVILTIEDNGRGIDLGRHREHVFGLYKRFHEDSEGKGMGLFIAKTQIVAMGGTIEIESEVNKGTKLTIEFPDTPTSQPTVVFNSFGKALESAG